MEVAQGNEAAFEVVYERYGRSLLSFCRHMLGSQEEAEEALQHSFAAAWKDLQRGDLPGPPRLRPWLHAIARNRCLSTLRERKPDALELPELASTSGLADHVAQRWDLRELLEDLGELPEEQRAALLLSELRGLSHADIADVLGRDDAGIKELVYRARSALLDWRYAREAPCNEIREQLSVLRFGGMRRRTLSRHLQDCPGCRAFREDVKRQRAMVALVLPVGPSFGLKEAVFSAASAGTTGGASAGAAAGGAGGAWLAGLGFGGLSSATAANVAVVVAFVGGLTAGVEAVEGGPAALGPPPATAVHATAPNGHGGAPSGIDVRAWAPALAGGAGDAGGPVQAPRGQGGESLPEDPVAESAPQTSPVPPLEDAGLAAPQEAAPPEDEKIAPGQQKKPEEPPGHSRAAPGQAKKLQAAPVAGIPPGQAKKAPGEDGQAEEAHVPPGRAKKLEAVDGPASPQKVPPGKTKPA